MPIFGFIGNKRGFLIEEEQPVCNIVNKNVIASKRLSPFFVNFTSMSLLF